MRKRSYPRDAPMEEEPKAVISDSCSDEVFASS